MISCIILAGGKGSRMQPKESKLSKLKKKLGKSKGSKKGKGSKKSAVMAKKRKIEEKKVTKAFLLLDEKPLVMHVVDTVKKFFPEIVVVVKTNAQQAEMKKLVDDQRVIVVADKSKSFSPVVGIKAGLGRATGQDVFVIGCDMPFVNGVTIFRLINRVKKGVDCIVPSKKIGENREYEPLCAIYKRGVFDDCGQDESMHELIDRHKKLLIPVYNDNVFFNVNTPDDMKQAQEILEQSKAKK